MESKRLILIKLSGELFSKEKDLSVIKHVIAQLKELAAKVSLGIVIGGGNFFRGGQDGKRLEMCISAAHEVGMLATLMNGRILQNLLKKEGLPTILCSALYCPSLAQPLSSSLIADALKENKIIIFGGGTGNSYFSTDTTAVVRALQINAPEIWKATTVDGIYSEDPRKNPKAVRIEKISFQDALNKKLEIMDQTALTLAQDHSLKIRVFDLFKENAFLSAYNNAEFGSLLQ